MSSNVQKVWNSRNLNKIGEKRAADAIQILGKALPCSVTKVMGSLVTVKFELTNIPFTIPETTMAIAGPEYIRVPIQNGCKGVAFPADARLGGVNGMGVGTADLTTPGNLAALTFFPIGNKNWEASENPNAVVIYGPDGVILRDAEKKTSITITPSEITLKADQKITIEVGAMKFTIDASSIVAGGNLTVQGNLLLQGVIQSGAGTPYAGNISTTGAISGGTVTQGNINLATHHHTAQGATAPTTAAQP